MSNIVPFNFESHEVRVVDIDGAPWFVLRDVLEAMGSSTPPNVAKRSLNEGLGDGYNDVTPIIDSMGRTQKTTIINEAAVTFLVARSNTDEGRRLNRWIHSEVLPSIRKTGKYEAHQFPQVKDPQLAAMVTMLTQMDQVKQEQAKQRSELEDLRAKMAATPEDYYTVAGYASLRGLSIDTKKANLLGRKAAGLSREYGLDVGKAHSSIHGTVNTYHVDILCEVFS